LVMLDPSHSRGTIVASAPSALLGEYAGHIVSDLTSFCTTII
jgi:hypothetical protein